MNNSDTPAMPVSVHQSRYGIITTSIDVYGGRGLTKREYFAGLVLQGLAASPGKDDESVEEFAKCAVLLADALLEELKSEY